MKHLHIVRDPNERLAIEVAARQSKEDAVSLLLIQDGVLARPPLDRINCYALSDDLEARQVSSPGGVIDYDGMARMIAEHDKVVVW